jgi:DNA-binding IclR family transcriptional regulator
MCVSGESCSEGKNKIEDSVTGTINMNSEAKHPVRTSAKTLNLIERLAEGDTAGITELAEEFEMAKSAVHNHLDTLREHGYVVKHGTEYSLSYKFLDIGDRLRSQNQLYQISRPELRSLADETGELVNLLIEQNGKGVYLLQMQGENAVDLTMNLGTRTHLHATALGKSILAHLPEDRVDEIIEHFGLPQITENTVTERTELAEQLEQIRNQDYALDDGERLAGLRCVATPITTDEGFPVGAISVSAPETRVTEDMLETEYPELLRQTANVIEIEVRY